MPGLGYGGTLVGPRSAGGEDADQAYPARATIGSVNRLEAAAKLQADHRLEHKTKIVAPDRNGQRKRFWVECSCGYASEPGKSWKYSVGAGVGHIQRIADAMRLAGDLPTETVVPRRVAQPKRRREPIASPPVEEHAPDRSDLVAGAPPSNGAQPASRVGS